jgi:IS30 family transposase
MRISHEAIYQSLFIEGRGTLTRELVACLRTGWALQEPRARSQNKPHAHVTEDVVLSERPAEAADRAVPGHWAPLYMSILWENAEFPEIRRPLVPVTCCGCVGVVHRRS